MDPHPAADGSLHVQLSDCLAVQLCGAGWCGVAAHMGSLVQVQAEAK